MSKISNLHSKFGISIRNSVSKKISFDLPSALRHEDSQKRGDHPEGRSCPHDDREKGLTGLIWRILEFFKSLAIFILL